MQTLPLNVFFCFRFDRLIKIDAVKKWIMIPVVFVPSQRYFYRERLNLAMREQPLLVVEARYLD